MATRPSERMAATTTLDYDERRLLEALYERSNPGAYHRRELDHFSFEEVAQDVGIGQVGQASSMTRPAMKFRVLEARGFVEHAKDPLGGAIRYRVTQLGERTILTGRVAALQAELDKQNAAWREEYGARRAAEGRAEAARAALREWLTLPWWRRLRVGGAAAVVDRVG